MRLDVEQARFAGTAVLVVEHALRVALTAGQCRHGTHPCYGGPGGEGDPLTAPYYPLLNAILRCHDLAIPERTPGRATTARAFARRCSAVPSVACHRGARAAFTLCRLDARLGLGGVASAAVRWRVYLHLCLCVPGTPRSRCAPRPICAVRRAWPPALGGGNGCRHRARPRRWPAIGRS